MKMKRAIALLLGLLLGLSLTAGVLASEPAGPDLSREGSLRLSLRSGDGAPVRSGVLTLWTVALLEEDGHFALTPDFAGSEIGEKEWSGRGASLAASVLLDYAEAHKLAGTPAELSQEGTVHWEGLRPGLYLAAQTGPGPKGELCTPFLVTLPVWDGSQWQYELDASPKTGVVPPPSPTNPTKPGTPGKPHLPQTGQLRWPVPVLICAGTALVLTGLLLLRKKRRS